MLVIPVYNEESCIEKVLSEWSSALTFQKLSYKILLINDGSTDNTEKILQSYSEQNKDIVFYSQKNAGHGQALLKGYHEALKLSPDFIFQVDSDDQFLASEFSKLWKMKDASPFILGTRAKRHDPLYRLIISKILKSSLGFLCGTKIADANIPFRLIEANFLRSILHCLPTGLFAPNVFISILASNYLGALPQVPVTHIERRTGQVSLIRLNLIKACIRSFYELIKFSMVLDFKASRMKLELDGNSNQELVKLHA